MKITFLLSLAFLVSVSLYGQGNKDEEILRSIILLITKAKNEKNVDAIMSYYSKDVIVSYPGIPDTDYKGFYDSYTQMMKRTDVTATTVPVIEEITVSGEMAIVRLTWETTIAITEKNTSSLRKARDFEVWKKENGTWKFVRGMWYHLQPGS